MSKRRDIEGHIRSLDEIDDIMSAMKNLAVMETQKLTRLLSAQERVVSTMYAAGTDFLSFYPETLPRRTEGRRLYLVIGSERGFCGDYNDKLLARVQEFLKAASDTEPILLSVGRKLAVRIAAARQVAVFIDGASIAEEVPAVMIQVMDRVQQLQSREVPGVPLTITVVSHAVEAGGVHAQALQPFEASTPRFAEPPLLNMPPRIFLAELIDLYLFSLLHKIFYSALLAENRARISHLEGATQHLGREASKLERKRNLLRQEDITQEIELLMLSAERLGRQ
jgi:F-type H+-transporting ATPase subunit gamma